MLHNARFLYDFLHEKLAQQSSFQRLQLMQVVLASRLFSFAYVENIYFGGCEFIRI